MIVISLEGMRFYAFHGFYPEERIIGGEYLVDISVETNAKGAVEADELEDTINYETVYEIVELEMKKPSKLLEHVLGRIVKKLKFQFDNIRGLEITLKKLSPPLAGEVASSGVKEVFSFTKKCGRCGKSVVCYGDDTCWCKGVSDIYSKTAESLKEQFGGKCLCKSCLSFYAG